MTTKRTMEFNIAYDDHERIVSINGVRADRPGIWKKKGSVTSHDAIVDSMRRFGFVYSNYEFSFTCFFCNALQDPEERPPHVCKGKKPSHALSRDCLFFQWSEKNGPGTLIEMASRPIVNPFDTLTVEEKQDAIGMVKVMKDLDGPLVNENEKEANVDEKEAGTTLCVVCFEKNKRILFLPCRHICVCNSCSKRVGTKCPVCRKKIQLKIQCFV